MVVLLTDPAAWAALVTLVVMEVVLGIDNLIFISILTNKLPAHQRAKARKLGISAALVMRRLVPERTSRGRQSPGSWPRSRARQPHPRRRA